MPSWRLVSCRRRSPRRRARPAAFTAAFHRARAADPDDHHGATLHLMQLGAEEISAMPSAYVKALFDQYAPRFEVALILEIAGQGERFRVFNTEEFKPPANLDDWKLPPAVKKLPQAQ